MGSLTGREHHVPHVPEEVTSLTQTSGGAEAKGRGGCFHGVLAMGRVGVKCPLGTFLGELWESRHLI